MKRCSVLVPSHPCTPALEAINRLRDDVDEVADFPLWIPEVVGTSSVAIGAFLIMAQLDHSS
jgi:hypothetical protein